jgi:hypothetical protein
MIEYSAGIVTAYGSAVRAGYTGTYEDFCRQQAGYAENAQAVEQAKQTAVSASQTANQAKQDAQTASTTAQQSAQSAQGSAQSAGQSAQDAQTAKNNAQTYAQSASASAGSAQQSAQSAQAVLESIPEDYSDLAEDVDKLKAELTYSKTIPLEIGSLDTNTGANYPKQTALRTSAYIPVNATKVTFSNCKARFFAYTQDGVFVGGYGTDGYTKDWSKYVSFSSPVYLNDLGGENYLFRIVFDNFTGDVTTENADAKYTIGVLGELKSNIIEEYTVGTGGDFATFTEMLIALENNTNEKIVYVQGGTYDIFEEMGGAEYIASITDTSGLNWRDVCHVVPWNTTIIGVGDVVLAWNPTDAEIIDQNHAFLFSPLNVSGTCKIKNIKIECSNARYGIHDETSGITIYNGVTHEFENVSVIYSTSTYGNKYAYGAGHNKNSKYKFKNCLFSSFYGVPWSSHDWPAAINEVTLFEFDNCVFWNNVNNTLASIRFSSADTVGKLDDVVINGCVFDRIFFGTERTTAIKQGYKVRTTLCKAYTAIYSDKIATEDRIAPVNYLEIS